MTDERGRIVSEVFLITVGVACLTLGVLAVFGHVPTVALVFACIGATAIVYGAIIEPRFLLVTKVQVPFGISRPLCVAVASDFHVGPYKMRRHVDRVVRRINALKPDVILLPGDFVEYPYAPPDNLEPLRLLQAPLGVFAVLGNHDTTSPDDAHIYTALETWGIRVLRNENDIIRLDGGEMAIAGITDLWKGNANLERAFAGIPPNIPVLLLSHNPDVMLSPVARRASVVVSGHTHGGQIRMPLFGAMLTSTKLHRRHAHGVSRFGDTTLVVTRGVGETVMRTRFLAPPEIMLLELAPTA